MNAIIQELATNPNNTAALDELITTVEALIEPGTEDGLIDWLGNAEYQGNETVEALAAQWRVDKEEESLCD